MLQDLSSLDLSGLEELLRNPDIQGVLRAALILLVGLLVARVLPRRLIGRRLHPQHAMVLRRVLSWVLGIIAFIWALHELGLGLDVLLGTAGILTIALGFASQTSVSNLISGMFLVFERPFVIGDIIEVAEAVGEVTSIDLISVRLRTFDNIMVRIPNETMLKSNVKNLTAYPIRRFDLHLKVPYSQDLDAVRELLFEVADNDPMCLEEPKPLFLFERFGEAGTEIQFSIWVDRLRWLEFKTVLPHAIKQAFDEAGIKLAVPGRVLGGATDDAAIPIRLMRREDP